MEPLIKVRNLWKIYGKGCKDCLANPSKNGNLCKNCGSIVALREVEFDVYRGEALGIVGESGSGKTTLLRILNFEILPTEGEYLIFPEREDLGGMEELDFLLHRNLNLFSLTSYQKRLIKNYLLGMVYQNPVFGLRMDVTVGGNVAEKLILGNWRSVERIRRRALELLQRTEIPKERIDDLPKNFSGGMQQRVQIAKALSIRPLVLFLDEPTNGLDLSVQARVLDLIRSLRREMDLTMILVSHDLGVIKHLTTRTIVMKDGMIVEAGLTDQILEDPQEEYTQLLVNSTL